MTSRSVCLIAGGLSMPHSRLQPWRYLVEVARGLAGQGHVVLLVSNCPGVREDINGVQVCRLESIHNPVLGGNKSLKHLLLQNQPEVTLWHTGLLSFLHQDFSLSASPKNIAIFTSPIYRFKDLVKIGPVKLLRGLYLSGAHLLGSCLPHSFIRSRIERSRLDALVVQTLTTCQQLRELGVRDKPIVVISPGVDPEWHPQGSGDLSAPSSLERLNKDQVVFIYFGPADPLRGFDTLLHAFASACAQDPCLRLKVLLRGQDENTANVTSPSIQITADSLSPGGLASRVSAADVIALPFELVPSDAPLSLLEAAALGKPVVTTPAACLPELVQAVPHFFARPADVESLCQALMQAARHIRETREDGGKLGFAKPRRARTWQEVGQEWSQLIQSL